jgi:hypothetical protein
VRSEPPVDLLRDEHDAYVERTSVAELIARRLDEDDPWRLALVQRHLVWDEVRMAHLLDSLLAGYPIGSLLVCRVRQEAHVLRESGVTRVAEKARAGTWQLLDGQQRVNALIALFTDRARFGRFYLDMTRKRIPEEVITRRRDARRALDYIAWRSDDAGGTEPPDNRDRFIELARLQAWASGQSLETILERARLAEADPRAAVAILNDIDPAFADELAAMDLRTAADRTARLLRAWAEPSIPVQYFTVDGPSDVLQVFTRINLAGVRLDGEDVFFAAVKTEWPNAEEHLDRVAAASPLLNRMTALRLLARLASRARSREDLLPLRVDRLNGPKGKLLVATMEQLAADDSPVLARIGVLGRLLTEESEIGHGLRLVDDGLLDHVVAWAATRPDGSDEAVMRQELPAVETYLLGAHSFRYPTVFREGFLRLGFAEAVAAGAESRSFPIERIVAGTHKRWGGLRRGQLSVAPIGTESEQRHLVDQNAALFLSWLQHIPFSMPFRDADHPASGVRQVEWDHIYPQARADKMRVRHPETGYLVHHQDRRLVWNGGNLWALDRPINNSASDAYPSAKFALIDGLLQPGHLPSTWPDTGNDALSSSEREDLLRAESLIAAGDIPAAMPHFRAYVVARALRIYRAVVDRYPGIAQFAPTDAPPQVSEDAPTVELLAHLGLDRLELPEEAAAAQAEASSSDLGDRFVSVLSLAERADLGAELRRLIALALELGLYPKPRESSVMVAPRANHARMLFTVWPQTGRGGRFSIYRWAPAIAEFFPGIQEEAARTALGPDGYGILDREEVPGFLTHLRELVGAVSEGQRGDVAQLTGEEIRAIAHDWLRAVDPEHRGVHYYEIAHAAQRQGTVSGKDPMATVLSVLRRHGRVFEQVGPGTYTWAADEPVAEAAVGRPTRYWALRTDQGRRADLWAEIRASRLRQGWGWDPEMDLEVIAERLAAGDKLSDWQQQAWGNRRMLTSQPDGIHVGDLVVVLHMPDRSRFSLVRVVGPYQFDGGQVFGDCGHILPVELITDEYGIGYTDARLSSRLQSSLGNRIRLWNLDSFGPEIDGLATAGTGDVARQS